MTQSAAERRFVRLAGAINAKASRLGLFDLIRARDLADIFLAADWHCTYCGIGIDPLHCSFDHVVPFDRKGRNVPANIVACCMTCQRGKSTKTPEEFEVARTLMVACEVCGKRFKPRFADWVRGYGRTCSRNCAGLKGGQTPRNLATSPT